MNADERISRMGALRVTMFPGESDAIRAVCEAGARYGYARMIAYLRKAWSADLQRLGMPAARGEEGNSGS